MKQTRATLCKVLSLLLLLTLTIPLFTACKSRAIPADKLALTPVGVVDGREVYYEELYFLSKNYLLSLQSKHGANTEALRAALDATVKEHIITNYAMLRLCENEGLVYDEKDKELKDSAQKSVDLLIESEFGGSRDKYREAMAEIGMTDHYFRFNTCVDTLYGKLPAHYGERGLIPTEDDAIRTYVKNHFAHTQHIAILVEDGETYEENRAKAEEALAKLQSGTSMYKMIGSTYNEDFSSSDYYFPRGSMDEIYEDAAFALAFGERSDIVESTGISNLTGNRVTCFYIIERLAPEDDYVNSHLTELSDQCADAIIAAKLAEVSATLSFEPNDFYRSLDLLALEAPGDGVDVAMILIIGSCVLAAATAAGMIVWLVLRKKKKKALVSMKKK